MDEWSFLEVGASLIANDGLRIQENNQIEVGSFLWIVVWLYNFGSGQFHVNASTYTKIPEGDLTINNQLDTATLDTMVVVEDLISGESFPVDVHLTWTATGEGFEEKNHLHDKVPGLVVNYHDKVSVRPAESYGNITGLGLEFAQMLTHVYAQFSDVKKGLVEITWPP